MKNFGLLALSALLLTLLALLALLEPSLANERPRSESIRIYTIEDFDAQGRVSPINRSTVQLLEAITQHTGLQFEVLRVPWKRAMENALQDDGILLGMSITKERQKKFAFSDPINVNRNWLVTRCDKKFAFNSLADLKGKLIGVVLGTSAGEAFDHEMNQSFKVENDTGAGIARIQKLIVGRMDALVWYGESSDAQAVEEHINRHFAGITASTASHDEYPVCVLPKPVSIVTNHFAMKLDVKKNVILTRLNRAMVKARKEGQLPAVGN